MTSERVSCSVGRVHDNPFGGYLRAHRERVDPADHGLPPDFRHRAAGLHREELAALAG